MFLLYRCGLAGLPHTSNKSRVEATAKACGYSESSIQTRQKLILHKLAVCLVEVRRKRLEPPPEI